MTIPQFCEANPAFTVGGLRWITFRAKDETDPHYHKFAPAFHRIGGRVLVNESKFLAIVTGE
jgi:hypothetical protein